MLRMTAILLFFLPVGFALAAGGEVVCKQQYALCASSVCKPIPGSSGKALCQCKVKTGVSVGNLPCSKRKPITVKQGLKQVISTYSFADAKSDAVMSCPSGSAWTNCLDAKCVVNPTDSQHAVCTCRVMTTGAYVTYGGQCNLRACKNRLWSGATKAGFEQGNRVLMKAMKLDKLPAKYCSGGEN